MVTANVVSLAAFDPPRHRSGMQALLEHSIQNYHPLPSDVRRRRSRANSRPSPYPRTIKTSFTSSPVNDQLRAAVMNSVAATADSPPAQLIPNALREVTVDPNVITSPQREKPANEKLLMVPGDKLERVFGLPPRPRVASTARRAAFGWTKRSTGQNKENSLSLGNVSLGGGLANMSQGITMTCVSTLSRCWPRNQLTGLCRPSETLRLSRPRPRARQTPAPGRPIRA